jgi:orotate phosphoribosyltransferase-like protein
MKQVVGDADRGDDCADTTRAHFNRGTTIKEIACDLKVSRNTVRKVLRSGETSFEYERVVQPRPKLGRWAAELEGLLAGNAAKKSREQ